MKKLFVLLSLALSCISASAEDLKTVVEQAIAYAKEQVAAGETSYEVAPVILDKSVSYTLSSEIALDLQKVRINGCGATVTVTDAGQITTSTFLNITGVNFDCENATVAPIGMTKTPSADLKLKDQYPGANQDMFYNLNRITLDGCNFREVKNSVFTANGNNWALRYFDIQDCIVQIASKVSQNVFDFKGSILDFTMTGNTIYATAKLDKVVFTLGNASNAQIQKSWGTDAIGHYVVTNNTFSSITNKAFGDQWPSKNNITVTAKGNIFYNVFRFQNKFVGNCAKDYTANDNIQFSTEESSTVENGLGVEVNPNFVAPTTALDFANIAALKANLTNKVESPAFAAYGSPRFSTVVVKNSIVKNVEGQAYECVLGPNMLTSGIKTVDGAAQSKPCIDTAAYPWIEYVNPTSTLDNGAAEVQQSNRWTDINPETGVKGEWIQATGANGSVNSPVISKQWGKFIRLRLANATKVKVYATGSASGSADDGNAVVLRVIAGNDTTVVTSTPGGIYGKGTASDVVETELDATKSYLIEIDGLVEKDIQITGLNIWGTNLKTAPVFHAPVLAADGAKWETILGPDMIVTKTKGGADKPGINITEFPWISYVNPTSTLDDGTAEVQQSNRWTDLNPETGVKGEFIQATGKNGSVNSPVVSSTWGKYIVFNVKGTATMNIYGAGSASGSAADNNCLVVTATSTDGEKIEATSTPGGIYGKGTASDVCTIQLNPAKKYMVKVIDAGKDIQITGINLAPVALDGDALGNTTGINDINAAETIVKAKKYVKNGRIVIESANGTYSVTGAQLK